MRKHRSLRERFNAKVDRTSTPEGCWNWTGALQHGYGEIRREYPDVGIARATHVAWAFEHGPVPIGIILCHRCDNPRCVRVEHLFLGTAADNSADAVAKGRTNQGMEHHSHKLEPWMIIEIRRRYAHGEGATALGREFGVRHPSILDIVNHKTWKSVL